MLLNKPFSQINVVFSRSQRRVFILEKEVRTRSTMIYAALNPVSNKFNGLLKGLLRFVQL